MKKLILASTSIYRKALLEKLRLPFECERPEVEEHPLDNESAHDMVVRLAQLKACAVARRHADALVIGSDQVASIEGHLLGKPADVHAAQAQLKQCSGKTVRFYTGLSLVQSANMHINTRVDTFDVHFKTLNDAQISAYIAKEMPLDCAGSFKSEGLGIALFSSLDGKDPNSLVGLPLIDLCDMLMEVGIDPLLTN